MVTKRIANHKLSWKLYKIPHSLILKRTLERQKLVAPAVTFRPSRYPRAPSQHAEKNKITAVSVFNKLFKA
jgi:hypothetical protein